MGIFADRKLTVSELTYSIKRFLEEGFQDVLLEGEISNFKDHVSGHWYFTLKDSSAQINGTMWKSLNAGVFFRPVDGMKVVVQGRISVYAPRGTYAIDVRKMLPAGVGELQLAFDRLKQKLEAEGLFDADKKRPLPELPLRIGIVTAPDGAAISDMVTIARRRFPLAELVLSPCKVQGEGAAQSIVMAMKLLAMEKSIDVAIIGRGGGSIEDLWAFNEEIVARQIASMPFPVVSAVGHEVDYTIADYAADLRAPTPSAAMELVTPDRTKIIKNLLSVGTMFDGYLEDIIYNNRQKLHHFVHSHGFRSIEGRLRFLNQRVDSAAQKVFFAADRKFDRFKHRVKQLEARIGAFDAAKIQKKGFVLVSQGNKFVTSANRLLTGEPFLLKFHDGEVKIPNE
ncbi:MAG: Exodeoxyribonuclease 7 large subunit [Ignavibacteriaceae bacterium]|nr:Exodeoxyribonuclease 7 large subunit [Ignavibacteriaceae bacterium]